MTRCTSCGKVIRDDESNVEVDGMTYHIECANKLNIIPEFVNDLIDEINGTGTKKDTMEPVDEIPDEPTETEDTSDSEPEPEPDDMETGFDDPEDDVYTCPICKREIDGSKEEFISQSDGKRICTECSDKMAKDVPESSDENTKDETAEDSNDKPEPVTSDEKPLKLKKLKRRFDRPDKQKKRKDDKEYDVDSFQEKFRRWKLTNFGNYVVLKTLSRDANRGEYLLESVLIPRSELPLDAVKVTNESHTYCLDTIKHSEWFARSRAEWDLTQNFKQRQFNATDAALHMTSNKIDNAMAIKHNSFEESTTDARKWVLIGVGVLAVVMILIMRMNS